MERFGPAACLVALGLLTGTGCGNANNGTVDACAPQGTGRIEKKAVFELQESNVTAKEAYSVDVAALSAGQKQTYSFAIVNTASASFAAPLVVTSVALVETDAVGKPVTAGAFECIGPNETPCDKAIWPAIVPASFDKKCITGASATTAAFKVNVSKPGDGTQHKATLVLKVSGDPQWKDKTRSVAFTTTVGTPRIAFSTSLVHFDDVSIGQTAESTFSVVNTGDADLTVSKLELASKDGVEMAVELDASAVGGAAKLAVAMGASVTTSLTIPPQGKIDGLFRFSPTKEVASLSATFYVHSNDPQTPKAFILAQAGAKGPKLCVSPSPLNWEDVPIAQPKLVSVTLTSCGTEDMSLCGITTSPATPSTFALSFETGYFTDNKPPTKAAPLPLPKGKQVAINVTYTPAESKPKESPDTGAILIDTCSGPPIELALTGNGAVISCAVPSIQVTPEGPVGPQDKVTIDGSGSSAAPGHNVTAWKWTSKCSKGAVTLQQKVSTTFSSNIVTECKVCLTVTDDAACESAPACVTVQVVPKCGIHVELDWAPSTGDPSAPSTADLDLHVARNEASEDDTQPVLGAYGSGVYDPWYEVPYDTWWYNPKPEWVQTTCDEYDGLSLDSKVGPGPEDWNIGTPTPMVKYWIGVHYAHKPVGPVPPAPQPTVRIFLKGAAEPYKTLVGPPLDFKDFWCAGVISSEGFDDCPNTNGSAPKIAKQYPDNTP